MNYKKERLNKPEHIKAIEEMNKHLEEYRREFKVKQFKSIESAKQAYITI